MDVTREGEEVPEARRAWTLGDLLAHQDDLEQLRALPRSARVSLASALDHADPDVGAARAGRLAERLGYLDRVLPFLRRGEPGPLRDALDIVGWWR